MRYFLDTNIIIYALKNSYPEIKNHFMRIPSQTISIPSIVIAEIEYGARKSRNYEKTIEIYRQFMNTFSNAEFNEKAAICYGEIRSYLEKKGDLIGPNDMLIASIVLAEEGILVTHNVKEFAKIPNLSIEDWTVNTGSFMRSSMAK
mgnify:CR=1 FL=1